MSLSVNHGISTPPAGHTAGLERAAATTLRAQRILTAVWSKVVVETGCDCGHAVIGEQRGIPSGPAHFSGVWNSLSFIAVCTLSTDSLVLVAFPSALALLRKCSKTLTNHARRKNSRCFFDFRASTVSRIRPVVIAGTPPHDFQSKMLHNEWAGSVTERLRARSNDQSTSGSKPRGKRNKAQHAGSRARNDRR